MLSVNSYFDDNVKSIAFQGKTLSTTVGVMDIGVLMTIIDGELEVKLPGTQSWNTFTNGDQFEVEANSSFEVKVIRQTAYHCTYE
jgi:uncharacterized protein YaiE (UPF0345 family)